MSMFNKLKQIKDLREKAKTMQSALAEELIEAEHKGITIKMDGNQKVHQVSIDESLMNDKTRLESTMTDAINNAVKKVQKAMVSKLQQMGDLDIPGLS